MGLVPGDDGGVGADVGREVGRGGAVLGHLPDGVGDGAEVAGCEVGEGDVDGGVAAGEGVGAGGGVCSEGGCCGGFEGGVGGHLRGEGEEYVGGGGVVPGDGGAGVVLEVGTYAGEVEDEGDASAGEEGCGADSTSLEDGGRVEGAGGNYDFGFDGDVEGVAGGE